MGGAVTEEQLRRKSYTAEEDAASPSPSPPCVQAAAGGAASFRLTQAFVSLSVPTPASAVASDADGQSRILLPWTDRSGPATSGPPPRSVGCVQ
jgi:hypothetical protein